MQDETPDVTGATSPAGVPDVMPPLSPEDEAKIAAHPTVESVEAEAEPGSYGTVAARREGGDVVLTADGAEINLTSHDAQLLFRELRSIITEL